jgi:hypothetical protein
MLKTLLTVLTGIGLLAIGVAPSWGADVRVGVRGAGAPIAGALRCAALRGANGAGSAGAPARAAARAATPAARCTVPTAPGAAGGTGTTTRWDTGSRIEGCGRMRGLPSVTMGAPGRRG